LERRAEEDALKRESYATKDTPAEKMAREQLKETGRTFRNLNTNEQRKYHTDMQKVMSDDRLALQMTQLVERTVGAAAAEIFKDYRTKLMANPGYQANDEELGVMARAHQLLTLQSMGNPGGTTAATPATAPAAAAPAAAAPANATPRPPADIRTYTGDTPPWPPPAGQKWQRNPATRLWRLVPAT
jgi:hypothetical protein